MPKASEIATALRAMADRLDGNPDLEIRRPSLGWHFYQETEKEQFRALARLLPRPVEKGLSADYGSGADIQLTHTQEGLFVMTSIPQKGMCKLVEPARKAVYECGSILSPEEDAELTEA